MSTILTQIRQSIKETPPHSFSMTIWITSICSLALLILNPSVRYFPKTYEQNILWECLSIGGSTSINCVQVDVILEAPLLPFFSGMLSYIFPPVIAVGILFWFFSLWTFAIIWKFSSKIGGYCGGICSIVLFLSVTISTNALSLASPEIIHTPFVITVLYLLLQTKANTQTHLKTFAWGLLLSLSYLFTTSSFLFIVAVCIIAGLIGSKNVKIVIFLLGSTSFLGIWHLLISIYTNTFFINTHTYIDESSQTLPSSFERQILGEGIYKTSLQSIAHSEKSTSMGTLIPTISEVDIFNTIAIFQEKLPFFTLLCAIIIIVLFFYEKEVDHYMKHLVLSGVVLFLMGIIQSIYANNQQTLLLSFLPFIAIGSLIIGVFTAQTSLPIVRQQTTPLLIIISFFTAMSSIPQEKILVEQSNSSRNMIEWISQNTNPRESIVSTRINTPLLILANRKWVQYSSPWDGVSNLQKSPRYILISQHDRWYKGELRGIGRMKSYFFDDNEWYGIFEYSSSIE